MKVEERVQKTLAYLNSDRGRKNWKLNTDRGYSELANLVAAIQTAARLIKYESIVEVLNEVQKAFDVRAAA